MNTKSLTWHSLVLLLLFASPAFAQRTNSLNTANVQITAGLVPLVPPSCEGSSCVGLTIDATAGGKTLTASIYNPTVTDQPPGFSQAQVAICYNTGAKIWVTDIPSASPYNLTLASGRGIPVLDGGTFTIYGFTAISNFRAIRDAAVSSTLYCTYYRQP